jgi:hypothetical protein
LKYQFLLSLILVSSLYERRQEVSITRNFSKELEENYLEYKSADYSFTIAQPKDTTVQKLEPSAEQRLVHSGLISLTNFYKGGSLYFTVEVYEKDPEPMDDDFTNYDDQVTSGRGNALQSTVYLHKLPPGQQCAPLESVRDFCKSYFTKKVVGRQYWYVLSGFLHEVDASVNPMGYTFRDPDYDTMMFSFQPDALPN